MQVALRRGTIFEPIAVSKVVALLVQTTQLLELSVQKVKTQVQPGAS